MSDAANNTVGARTDVGQYCTLFFHANWPYCQLIQSLHTTGTVRYGANERRAFFECLSQKYLVRLFNWNLTVLLT